MSNPYGERHIQALDRLGACLRAIERVYRTIKRRETR